MLNQILISDALAQGTEAAAATPEFSFTSLVPLFLIFAVFYFLIIRPQTKKYKEHQEMVSGLKIGNKVVTSGGIVGVVKEIHDKEDQIEIEIAEGVNVKILRNYVSDLVVKKDDSKKTKEAKKTK